MIIFVLLIIASLIFLAFGTVVFRGAPYVPTKTKVAKAALEALPLKTGDLVVDLGSGDGTFLIAAAQKGFKVVGFELNPFLVILSRLRTTSMNVEILWRDFWLTPLPKDTKAVYVFLAGPYMKKLVRRLSQQSKQLGVPIYVASNAFTLPELEPINKVEGVFIYKISS